MKTFEEFLNEQIYTAKEISDYMKNISDTPETDIPDYYISLIKKEKTRFEKKMIDIQELLKNDESLKEYVMSGEDRYEYSDYEPSHEELYSPIVIYKGEVIDGYNRTATLYKNGEKKIEAYISIN